MRFKGLCHHGINPLWKHWESVQLPFPATQSVLKQKQTNAEDELSADGTVITVSPLHDDSQTKGSEAPRDPGREDDGIAHQKSMQPFSPRGRRLSDPGVAHNDNYGSAPFIHRGVDLSLLFQSTTLVQEEPYNQCDEWRLCARYDHTSIDRAYSVLAPPGVTTEEKKLAIPGI